MNAVFIGLAVFLTALGFAGLYRAFVGPTTADRVAAINVTETKVTTIIVLVSVITAQEAYLSVALVYAMVSFVTTIGVTKYLTRGTLNWLAGSKRQER
jgi:multicomponent Na+:H+ antiporter subunit F